jgi:hypothetical protein
MRAGLSSLAICAIATCPAWAGNEAPAPDPVVKPGDEIAIACTALSHSDAESDVRVVLTVSAMPGDAGPGYKKVLATDAQVAHGAVRVRIPSVPDLENRTVNVDVYVVGDTGAKSCDAGSVNIVRHATPAEPVG